MKSLVKLLGMLLVLGALAGGVYLASKNQETRRGAAANDTVISLLPATANYEVGKTVIVTAYIDTGKSTDLLESAELHINFDRTKLKFLYVDIMPSTDTTTSPPNKVKYQLIQDNPDNGSGPLSITVTGSGSLDGGAVGLFKMYFSSIGSGSAEVGMNDGQIKVESESIMWTINTNNKAIYTIGGDTPTITVPPTNTPTNTVTPTNTGVPPTATPTSVPSACGGLCNTMFTDINGGCQTGLVCAQTDGIHGLCAKPEYSARCSADWQSSSPLLSCCLPPAAATLTPTITPSPTPIDSQPDGTPKLNFKMTFAGVNQAAQCANWPVQVMVMGSDGATRTYNNVGLTKTSEVKNGLAVYVARMSLSDFNQKSNIAVFVKGPKHLQTKYGKDNQEGFYGTPGGEISGLTTDQDTSPMFDFSGYPLLAGDMTRYIDGKEAGVIDGRDFSFLKQEVTKQLSTGAGQDLPADLNGNCAYESQDVALFMVALKDKQEQLY